MSQVVPEGNGFGEVFIQVQSPGNSTGNLGDFQGVCQAGDVMVAQGCDEDLSFVFQPAEGFGVDDTIAVTLESRSYRRWFFIPFSASRKAASGGAKGKRCFLFFDVLSDLQTFNHSGFSCNVAVEPSFVNRASEMATGGSQ